MSYLLLITMVPQLLQIILNVNLSLIFDLKMLHWTMHGVILPFVSFVTSLGPIFLHQKEATPGPKIKIRSPLLAVPQRVAA